MLIIFPFTSSEIITGNGSVENTGPVHGGVTE